jgi:Tfp pilus assembly protein PilX
VEALCESDTDRGMAVVRGLLVLLLIVIFLIALAAEALHESR